MAARVDWTRWTWPLGLAFVGSLAGLLAGINPPLAIAAALGLAFLLLVFADLAGGVVLFTVIIFFETIPGTSGASLTKAAGLLLALGWLAVLATRGDAKADLLRQQPFVSAVLILFIAWAALSFAWSDQPSSALEASYRLALNGALLFIVFTAVRTRRDATRVLAAFVVGATVATLVGILTGGTHAQGADPTARLGIEYENPNQLAATLVASLALAVGLGLAARRSSLARAAAFGAAAFSLLGILLTVSRGGLVALAVAAVAAIFLGGRWRPAAAMVSILLVLCAVFYFLALAPPLARERVTASDAGSGREDIWRVAWRVVESNPVQGIGAGNFPTSSIHYLLAPGLLRQSQFIVDEQKVTHNLYLGTWAELGIIGLLLLLSLIVSLLRLGLQAIREFERKGDISMEILARAQLIALIGVLASFAFSSDVYKKQLWLLFAMMPTMLAIARSSRVGGST